MIKWLEKWSMRLGYKKKLKDLTLFSLGQKSLKSHLKVFKHMKGL